MRICAFETVDDAAEAIARLGADPWSVHVMARKGVHLSLLLEDLSLRSALLLKQEALAKGAEAALAREAMDLARERVSALLMGTHRQLGEVAASLESYSPELREVGLRLGHLLAHLHGAGLQPVELGDRLFEWGTRVSVMGIVNVTPDSFSGDGLAGRPEEAVERGRQLIEAGADLLDIGGESSRPGAEPVSTEEELARILPVVEGLADAGVPLSVDTSKAAVAEKVLAAGAEIVNDITALTGDPEMPRVVADSGAVVCLMHMQGEPRTMQQAPSYRDAVGDVSDFLCRRIAELVGLGVVEERIVVDPGIGFGKSLEHNLDLLNGLDQIRAATGRPILVGPSRKSFLGRILDKPVDDRVWATAGAVALAVARGADIVRVHDVSEMVEVVRVSEAIARRPRWCVPEAPTP